MLFLLISTLNTSPNRRRTPDKIILNITSSRSLHVLVMPSVRSIWNQGAQINVSINLRM